MDNEEEKYKLSKTSRILRMFDLLAKGDLINKADMAQQFHVDEKSIQRDFNDIRCYLQERNHDFGIENELIYDKRQMGYRFKTQESDFLSNQEILAVAKILLDSRAFTKKEMMDILDKLVKCCLPEDNSQLVKTLIVNESTYYIEPRHKKKVMDKMWQIGKAIKDKHYIQIKYIRSDGQTVIREVQPQAVMFSEFYFYLAAQIRNIDRHKEFENPADKFPTIYRIDRIDELKVLQEKFQIDEKDRFSEAEYRKRIQFMYGGKLQTTEFWCEKYSVEAVLDRLPTAEIVRGKSVAPVRDERGRYRIKAETFGKGIDMWLRSQGDSIEVIKENENNFQDGH